MLKLLYVAVNIYRDVDDDDTQFRGISGAAGGAIIPTMPTAQGQQMAIAFSPPPSAVPSAALGSPQSSGMGGMMQINAGSQTYMIPPAKRPATTLSQSERYLENIFLCSQLIALNCCMNIFLHIVKFYC